MCLKRQQVPSRNDSGIPQNIDRDAGMLACIFGIFMVPVNSVVVVISGPLRPVLDRLNRDLFCLLRSCSTGGCLMEGSEKIICGLRSRQRDLAIDNEAQHTVHSKPPCPLVCRFHHFQALVAIQNALGSLPFQAGFDNHVNERLAIADVPALREVRPEQRLDDGVLKPCSSANQIAHVSKRPTSCLQPKASATYLRVLCTAHPPS